MNPAATNPYRPAPGSLPPFLAGRDGEVSAVRNAIGLTGEGGAAVPIIMTGLRGMGKTALLRTARRMAEEAGAIVLYAEAGDDLALEEAFRRSLQRAQQRLKNLPTRLGEAIERAIHRLPVPVFEIPGAGGEISLAHRHEKQQTSLTETLEQLNDATARADRFLTICVDEIQDADAKHLRPVVTYVHETAEDEEKPILFLGAGLPGTPSHLQSVKTYTERWRYLDLGLLSEEQSTEALVRPAAQRGVQIDDDALDLLLSETAGYPFFVQEYGSSAWTARNGDHISLQDVQQVVPGVRRVLEASLYEQRFRGLTPRELRYALALTDLGPGIHSVSDVAEGLSAKVEELSSIRNQLVKKDVLVSPATGLIEFRIPLTDRYIASHRTQLEQRAKIGDDTRARRRLK